MSSPKSSPKERILKIVFLELSPLERAG